MSGTKTGGKAAARTNRLKHGEDFYARIGALGGKASHTGGFAADVTCDCNLYQGKHFVRQCAGKKGGRSRRNGNQGSNTTMAIERLCLDCGKPKKITKRKVATVCQCPAE